MIQQVLRARIWICVGIIATLLFQNNRQDLQQTNSTTTAAYELFDEMYGLLTGSYYTGFVDQQDMVDQALRAYAAALGDPYTLYFNGAEFADFQDSIQGQQEIAGVGALVMKHVDGGVMIEQVIKNTPAARGGLRPLDIIREVDGMSVVDETIMESVQRIRGEIGSEVALTIARIGADGEPSLIQVTLERAAVKADSVWLHTLAADEYQFLHIELLHFGEKTDQLLYNKLRDTDLSSIDGVILDIRSNGGGILDEGVTISSHFVPRGEVVLQADYRAYRDEVHKSLGYTTLQDKPVVVLIDGASASASEIIALALRQYRQAPLVGQPSFGKGTIQAVSPLSLGSLKYTVGEWSVPGVPAVGTGIIPDVIVEFDVQQRQTDQTDTQLDKAKETLVDLIIQ